MATNPFNSEKLTISSTAVGFTTATINLTPNGNKVSEAVFSVEDDDIRISTSSTPTATTGMLVKADTIFKVTGEASIRAFKAIRVTTDAVINVEYFYGG